jgi:hypothetical protein
MVICFFWGGGLCLGGGDLNNGGSRVATRVSGDGFACVAVMGCW